MVHPILSALAGFAATYLIIGASIGMSISQKFPWRDRIVIASATMFLWLPIVLSVFLEDKLSG